MQKEYACILVPDFPLQALLRAEPELTGNLAILGPQNRIIHVSKAAKQAGIIPGMLPTQARSIAPDLLVRSVHEAVLQSAHRALLDIGWSFSPRLQDPEIGLVILDLTGTSRLYPSKPSLGCAIHAACRRMGFSARIAFANGPTIAAIAARAISEGEEPVIIIPSGSEAESLAQLPLTALNPSQELYENLKRLGLRTIGDFAKLDRKQLGIRLGIEAYNLHLLAHGQDKTPFDPRSKDEVFEESVFLEYSVERIEPLLFPLNAAVENLAQRLEVRQKALSRLRLTLHLDPEGKKIVEVTPALPTSDQKALLSLLRLRLEEGAPSPIQGFTLEAIPSNRLHAQTDLFAPPLPEPSQLATLLAQLQALVAPQRVGIPALSDCSHKPGIEVRPFTLSTPNAQPPITPTLSFWRFSDPIPLDVRTTPEGSPLFICTGPISGQVIKVAGPWYIETGWWKDSPDSAAYYDVEIKNQGLFRLRYDLIHQKWFAEGWYD